MTEDTYTFIRALRYEKIYVFTFSMGALIAQDLTLKHPELIRRLVLTGTGPRGCKDIDKVVGIKYWDIVRATLTRSDPKEFLFFNRNSTGIAAGRAFIERLKERTESRDQPMGIRAFQRQDGSIGALRRPASPNPGLHVDLLPRFRPRWHLPVP